MTYDIHFTKPTTSIDKDDNVGNRKCRDEIVARTHCPFCDVQAAFRQIGTGKDTGTVGQMVALSCDSCGGVVSCDIDRQNIHPKPSVSGVEEDLPDKISEYYQEGLSCLNANAPNGAATVFRKVIDATCIYYDVSEIENNDTFYDMIEKLADEEVITESLRQTLLGVKDGGRDGAHINAQDPSMEQAHNLKQMIDSVLTASVIADEKLKEFREDHPNQFTEDS